MHRLQYWNFLSYHTLFSLILMSVWFVGNCDSKLCLLIKQIQSVSAHCRHYFRFSCLLNVWCVNLWKNQKPFAPHGLCNDQEIVCFLSLASMLNWGGLSSWKTRHKNFSKHGIWTMRFYELIWYWKSQIDPRFSKMFDHIGSLPYISTVPLRLHAAHVSRLQVFQGGGKCTMNKSLNSKRIVSKLSVFLKVSLLLSNNKSKFSYNVTSHK